MRKRLEEFFGRQADAGVASVYLFGSQARGAAHRDSDVDVAVLLDRAAYPTAPSRFDYRLRTAAELDRFLAGPLSDVLILNDAPPLVGRAVIYDGVPVVIRDVEQDHAFRRDVQLRAADLEPFLRRHRRRLLEVLAG